jgi:hypothetical protein
VHDKARRFGLPITDDSGPHKVRLDELRELGVTVVKAPKKER